MGVKLFQIVAIGVAPLLVGAAFWFSHLWFLAGFMFVPLFFAAEKLSRAKKFLASFFFIAISALILAYPILSFRSVQSFVLDQEKALALVLIIAGWVFFIASLATLALWIGISFFHNPLVKILALSSLWVGFEIVKTAFSFNLQWVFVGEPLIEFLPLAIYARLGGAYPLSFLVMFFNVSLYESLKCILRDSKSRAGWIPLAFLVFLVAGLIAGGAYLEAITKKAPIGLMKVALVQPGSFYAVPSSEYYLEVRKRTMALVSQNGLRDIELMILPGNYAGLQRFNKFDQKAMAEILEIASSSRSLIAGFTLRAADGKDYETHALVATADGKWQFSYKEILLPLSEYVPAFLKKMYSLPKGVSNYAVGKNQVLTLPSGIKIGVISCSEEFVPELARRAKASGANLLVITGSNDDFSSQAAFMETQRAARFRALENNMYVVQVLKNGVSSVIDPYGRVIKSLAVNEEGVLVHEIPLYSD